MDFIIDYFYYLRNQTIKNQLYNLKVKNIWCYIKNKYVSY